MSIRAIIFDVYGTLLELGPPPADADARWRSLCQEMLHCEPRLSWKDFSLACSRAVSYRHESARDRGIAWPEIYFPSVVAEVAPEFARLSRPAQDEFLFRQSQASHTTRMASETADALRWLKQRSCALGIASNSQTYTRRELQEALTIHGLDLTLFAPDLCFWSYEHGFSKPDPHVFQMVSARLEARGIRAEETLMVGNRTDNDIKPASAYGWHTWQVAGGPLQGPGGSWADFKHHVQKISNHSL